MNQLVHSVGWTLLNFLWQGALIGAATAALLGLARNARAEQRYLIACAGLLACLAWPALELMQRLTMPAAAATGFGTAGAHAAASAASQLDIFASHHMAQLVAAWTAGCALLLLRTIAGMTWISRMGQHGSMAGAGLQRSFDALAERMAPGRPVRLRVLENLASPITAGWLRPVVLVPAALVSGMPADLLEALLAHELAHVKRWDYLVNLLQNAIETLLFYHPAVWWISRQVRAEREHIADDLAAQALGEPRRLALALSELEKLQFAPHGVALAAHGGDLLGRIRRLVKPKAPSSNWAAPVLVLMLAIAGVSWNSPAQAVVRIPALADFSSCKKPIWPEQSLRDEETGTVTLRFTVDAGGHPIASAVERSSGHAALDEAARTGISKCRFKPATENGNPVASSMKMQYVWTLE